MTNQARTALWLGMRLRSADRRHGVTALLVGLSAIAALSIGALCAAPGVLAAQRVDRDRLTIRSTDALTGLYAASTYMNWKDDVRVRKVLVARTSSSVAPPPGLERFPSVGEVHLSPALEALATTERDLSALKSGATTPIARAGLVNPQEQAMYVGSTPEDMQAMGISPNAMFGASSSYVGVPQSLVFLAVSTATIFVTMPVILVLTAALSLLITRRVRRLDTLSKIGMSTPAGRIAVALDGTVLCLLGGAAGAIGFIAFAQSDGDLYGVRASWFADQVDTGWSTLLCALLPGILATSFACALKGRPVVSQSSNERQKSLLRLLPLVAGIVGMVSTVNRRVDGSEFNVTVVLAATLLTIVGVPFAAPAVIKGLASRLVRSKNTTTFLAGARLLRGAANRRTGHGLSCAVLLVAAVAPLIAQAAPQDFVAAEQNAASGRVVATISGLVPGTTIQQLNDYPGSLGATVAVRQQDKTTFVVSCEQIRRIIGRSFPQCRTGLRSTPSEAPVGIQSTLNIADGSWQFIVGSDHAKLIPRATPGLDPLATQAIVITDSMESYWRIGAYVLRGANLGVTYANTGGLIGGPDQPYRQMQLWLQLGVLCLVIAGGIALLVGLAEQARAQKRVFAGIMCIGASAGVSRETISKETLVRLLTLTTLTVGAAGVLMHVSTTWVGAQSPPNGWLAQSAIVLVVTAALAAMVAPALVSSSDPLSDLHDD